MVPLRSTADRRSRPTDAPTPGRRALPTQAAEFAALTDAAALAHLRDQWDALLSVTPRASAFQTWEWAATWWEVYGAGRWLRLLVAKGGRPALWPLYRGRASLVSRVGMKELRFLGTGAEVSPEYMGPLVAAEDEDAAVAGLVGWLRAHRGDWDVARLSDVRSDATWVPRLVSHARAAGLPVDVSPRARCPYTVLPATWEEYLFSLSRNLRHNIRRRVRRLEQDHAFEMFRWGAHEPVAEAIERLAELHRRRWSALGVAHSFSTDSYTRFHRRFASRLQERGWLDLYCLRIGEQIISVLYMFTYGGVVHVYQSGFDPAWSEYSVGTVLRAFATEDAIRRGLREIDYLKGEHDYKESWANAERGTVNIVVYNTTTRGLAYLAIRRAARWGRRVARRRLPAGLRRPLQWARRRLRAADRGQTGWR